MKLSLSMPACLLAVALMGASVAATAAKPAPVAKKAIAGKPAKDLKLSPKSRYYAKLKGMTKAERDKARARWRAMALKAKQKAQKTEQNAKAAKDKLLRLLKKK